MPQEVSRNASTRVQNHRKPFGLRHACLFALALGATLAGIRFAHASCSPIFPGTGDTVTCDTSFPNPAILPVTALPGATDVTVTVEPGAQLQVVTTAISLNGADQITNNGSISGTFTGIEDTGPVAITNAGQIVGNFSSAIELSGSGISTINNTGTINGNCCTAIDFDTVAGSSMTLNNMSGASINGDVTGSGAGNITIVNAGNFNGAIYIHGSGVNSVTATTNINGIVFMAGAQNTVVNSAVLNSGLILHGSTSNVVTNNAGATINRTFDIDGTGVDTVTNTGTINSGIEMEGSGTLFDSGTINGGPTAIRFEANPGPFTLTLGPGFLINGNVLGTGDDTFQLGGSGMATFNAGNIGRSQQYRGFDVFNKVDASTWTLTGTGSQNWTISNGTLIGDTNSLGGDIIANDSALVFNQGFTGTHAGIIVGSGTVGIQGGGTVVFTANNIYTGGTTINGATLQLGDGGASGSVIGNVVDNGAFAFDRSDTYVYGGGITGGGAINQIGAGVTKLTSNSGAFTGATSVNAGTLAVDGTLGAASSTLTVNNGGTLTGTGAVGGAVTVNSGGTLSGSQGTTLTTGPLTLTSGSNIDIALGTPASTAPLFNVNGSLTLAGTMNVTDLGGFGPGVYRLFNYTGALTDNGVAFGTLPPGTAPADLSLQTATPQQVNLVNTGGQQLQFWDGPGTPNEGVVNGGSGTWDAANPNWTNANGTINGPWSTDFAIFEAAPGTVTVDDSKGAISAKGMQFAVDGYVLNGGTLTLVGPDPIIRVGDGTLAGAGFTATIDNVLAGSGSLIKTDLGTLVLGGANTYAGGTLINGGTIAVSSDANLGAASGGLTFVNGGLETTANMTTGRTISILQSASFVPAANTALELTGPISGGGSVSIDGPGTIIVSRNETYLGGTDINSGTLQLGNGGTSGSDVGDIANNGTLVVNRSDSFTYDNTISGTGNIEQIGSGTITLAANNTYTGATTVASGGLDIQGALTSPSTVSVGDGGSATLTIENGGQVGSTTGVLGNLAGTTGVAIVTNANSAWTNSGTLTIGNAGSGLVIVSDHASLNADTIVIAAQSGSTGTLVLGAVAGQAADLGPGTVDPQSVTFGAGNGTLVINQSDPSYAFNAALAGPGIVHLIGPGTTIFTADSSGFIGSTAVDAGTLDVEGALGSGASTLAVNNGGTLTGGGTAAGAVTVNSGGTLAGTQGQILTTGPLTLSSGSNIDVALGLPGTTGLFDVNGPLTLAGTLNVADLGGFSTGTYRLFDYSGTLTNNSVAFGTLPVGVTPADLMVQTAVPQQVNLVNTGGSTVQFWNGTDTMPGGIIAGGDGTWDAVGINWTNASAGVAQSWAGGFAIFAGNPGTVTVDGSSGAISAAGMQFAIDGYQLTGDTITLTGPNPIIRVGDGTDDGAHYTATINNVLAGSGELVKTDLGTLVLGGANTYAGGTLIYAGTLSISSDANLGASAGALTFQNGTLETTANMASARAIDIAQSATFLTEPGTSLELDGPVSGAGSLSKDGDGTLIIVGTAAHTGGTIIDAGTLQIGNGGTSGTLSGDVADNGSLVIDRSDVHTFAGAISGTGSFTQAGTGTTILTGNNDYAGGTTIAAGTLQIGNGGTSGDIIGDIVDNGQLVVDRSDSFTFLGSVSGTGSVEQLGAGTITVTGNNTFTGGLTIANGAIELGDGNSAGAYSGNVVDNGTLAFNRGDAVTFPGVISGNGVLQQIGAGSTTLTADSSAFAGSTAVNAGTLIVNGKLGNASSALAVNNGGTLAGTGAIGGSTTVNTGGTLAPAGAALGTLTVNGNLTFAPGSTYQVNLTPAQSDLVVVGGQAKLAGEVQVVVAPGTYPANAIYPIVTAAGGVNGTFDTVDPPSTSLFFEPALRYDADHAYIVLTDAPFTSVAQTRNQMATAGALGTLPVTSPLYDAVFNLGTAAEARQAFDVLSGEAYASTAGALMEESRYVRDAVLARLRGAYDAVAPSDPHSDPGLWVQALGAFGSSDSDGNAADLTRSVAGAIGGYDMAVLDDWHVGAAGAFVHSDLDIDARASHSAVDSFDLSAYGAGQIDPIALRAGVAYAWQNVTVRRAVDFSGFSDSTGSHYRAPSLQAFGEAGYDIALQPVTLEPFADAAYVNVDTHGFSETGNGAALIAQDQTLHTIFTTAGLHASSNLGIIGGAPVTALGTLGWEHAFGDVTPIETLAFAEGSAPFTVAGVPLARNSAVVETGFNVAIATAVNVAVAYSGRIAGDARDNAVRLTLDSNF